MFSSDPSKKYSSLKVFMTGKYFKDCFVHFYAICDTDLCHFIPVSSTLHNQQLVFLVILEIVPVVGVKPIKRKDTLKSVYIYGLFKCPKH